MRVVNTGQLYRIYSDDLKVHNELPANVYIVRFHPMQGFYLEKYSNMEVKEEKIYGVHMAKIKKAMNTFKDFDRNLGIILSGDKGIGKSLFARILCNTSVEAGYPVIVVDTFVPGIHSFIEEIEQEVVVLFDEFDKTFADSNNRDDDRNSKSPQTSMLSLLDGVSAGKKMYIVTCNKFYNLNEYLINRPGRFHYHFRFNYPTAEEIKTYLQDKIDQQFWGEIAKVVSFSGKVNLNYDCLRAIAYELQNGEKFEDAINDLNILNLSDQAYDIALQFTDGTTTFRSNYKFDLFSNRPESVWLNDINGCSVQVEFIPGKAKYETFKGCSVLDGKSIKVRFDDDGEDNSEVKKLVAESLTITRVEKTNYSYLL